MKIVHKNTNLKHWQIKNSDLLIRIDVLDIIWSEKEGLLEQPVICYPFCNSERV